MVLILGAAFIAAAIIGFLYSLPRDSAITEAACNAVALVTQFPDHTGGENPGRS